MKHAGLKRYLYLVIAIASFAWVANTSANELEELLDGLAAEQGLEFVYGDRFPSVNPYGSYGSSYVLDPVVREGIENSVFFLARRANDSRESGGESALDLVRQYAYFYVYAEREVGANNYVVKDVISEGVGLKGMSLFYGSLDFDSLSFVFVDTGEEIEAEVIDHSKLGTPVLISSVSSTVYLINYDGEWIQSVERDW
jgi:hypothetical protein